MKCTWNLLLYGATALLSLSAFAQTGSGAGTEPGAHPAAVGCSTARNPQNCEARQKAMESCKDKSGSARRRCIEDSLPPRDCSKAKSPQRCEEQQTARDACKGKYGKEHRTCMREQIKKKPKKR